jgi:hypothetical protein
LSFDATPTARAIEHASADTRDALAAKIDDQIDAGRRAVKQAGKAARALDDDAREHFDAVREEVAARQDQLQETMRRARSSSDAAWEDARAQLATDYAAYVEAVKRAQLSATADLSARANRAGDAGSTIAAAGAATVSYDARATADAIRSAGFAARDELAENLRSSLDRSHNQLASLRGRAAKLDDAAQARLDEAARSAEIRERQLKTTLAAALRADADAWSDARERLAEDYRSYAEALRQAEAAGNAELAANGANATSSATVSGNLVARDRD